MVATVIIVQGGPAVGKTTLAQRLAVDLQMGLLTKDDIKEMLFDKLGLPISRDDSRVYGTATMTALFAIAREFVAAGKSFIIESAFHVGLAEQDLAAIAQNNTVHYIQVFCHTVPEIQQARYRQRTVSGGRHPGHRDDPEAILPLAEYSQTYGALNIPDTIDVDTTELNDAHYGAIKEVILQKMAGWNG